MAALQRPPGVHRHAAVAARRLPLAGPCLLTVASAARGGRRTSSNEPESIAPARRRRTSDNSAKDGVEPPAVAGDAALPPAPSVLPPPLPGMVASSRRVGGRASSARAARARGVSPAASAAATTAAAAAPGDAAPLAGVTQSPTAALRDMGIVSNDEYGRPYVDVACLGRGQRSWYALAVVENKETRYLQMLSKRFKDDFGLTLNPDDLYTPPAADDAAAKARSEELLSSADMVAWVPRRSMKVYSPNTDRLSEREVAPERGTGGATLMLHTRLTPAVIDALTGTYYFLGFRHVSEVPARLLARGGLLPPDEDESQVYCLPMPCESQYVDDLAKWCSSGGSEDEDSARLAFYGPAGGTTFGQDERYDKDKRNMDVDESGNQIYRRGYAGTYNNPNRWHDGKERTKQGDDDWGRPRGEHQRGAGGRGERQTRGRTGASAGRGDRWQSDGGSSRDRSAAPHRQRGEQQRQQQQQQQRRQDSGWHGGRDHDSGAFVNDGDMENNAWQDEGDAWQEDSDRGQWGGQQRSSSVRERQVDYMQSMGSYRYADGDADGADDGGIDGFDSGASLNAAPPGGIGGRDDEVRLRQMAWMGELGSDRYSDNDDDGDTYPAGNDNYASLDNSYRGGGLAANGDYGGSDDFAAADFDAFDGEYGRQSGSGRAAAWGGQRGVSGRGTSSSRGSRGSSRGSSSSRPRRGNPLDDFSDAGHEGRYGPSIDAWGGDADACGWGETAAAAAAAAGSAEAGTSMGWDDWDEPAAAAAGAQSRRGGRPGNAGGGRQSGRASRGSSSVRERQVDYMQSMGSYRYADGDADAGDWSGFDGDAPAGGGGGGGGGKDDGVRLQQMEWMEARGSERYGSDPDDELPPPARQGGGRGGRRGGGRGGGAR